MVKNPMSMPVVAPPDDKQTNDDVDEFFDAPDHFSDDEFDSDFDEEQAPDDPITDKVIRFHPLAVWNNSEANEVEYILPPNYGMLTN